MPLGIFNVHTSLTSFVVTQTLQYSKFVDLNNRYAEWLREHRHPYRARARTELIRDVGDATGTWDDNGVDEHDEYERDGFLVSDDEEDDEEDNEGEENHEGDEGSDFDPVDDEQEQSEAKSMDDDFAIGTSLNWRCGASPNSGRDGVKKRPGLNRKRMDIEAEEMDGSEVGTNDTLEVNTSTLFSAIDVNADANVLSGETLRAALS